MNDISPTVPVSKRTDVDYKRPPEDHQFTTDNQPRVRKKKVDTLDPSALELMNNILAEPQRVMVNGTVVYMTNVEAIIRKGIQLLEAGNRTLRRPVEDLLMSVNRRNYAASRAPRLRINGVDVGPMAQWPDGSD